MSHMKGLKKQTVLSSSGGSRSFSSPFRRLDGFLRLGLEGLHERNFKTLLGGGFGLFGGGGVIVTGRRVGEVIIVNPGL